MALVVLLALVVGGGYLYVDSKLGGIKRVPVAGLTPERAGQPIDILLVGSDSRSFVSNSQQAKSFGSAQSQTGQRSDVIIVVRLVPSNGHVEMLSIPRDLWVPIAGTGGSNKINSAFNKGPSQLVKTIQSDLKIPINHVMMANFPGFSGMVDSLGGIYLDFPMPVKDAFSGLDISRTGCQLVNGAQSLALVRSRHLYYFQHGSWHYDGMSDWSRIRRQQAFFHGLLSRVHGVFPNLFRLNSFLGATVSDLTVDSSFASSQMISLGMKYRSLSSGNLTTTVLPTSPAVIGGQDVLIAPQPQARQAISQFLSAGSTTSALGAWGPTEGAPARTGTGATAGAILTAASTPSSGIINDNPQSLPEPWNPNPC